MFSKNLLTNFVLIAVFIKVALQKELSIAFYPDLYVFMSFGIVQVYLHSEACRVYKGHLQNEWVIKPFLETSKKFKDKRFKDGDGAY